MTSKPQTWTVEFDRRALKELRALGSADRVRVLRFLDERVAGKDDPRQQGKVLTGELSGIWRYRVGDIRILARLEYDRLVVFVVEVGNRREVYR
ncbi:MAG: type II toxin-antitoxin system RelE/ParE family toxin [Devosia sp.]